MAARHRKLHWDEVRERIKTSQLLNRLQNNGLGKLKKEMTLGQIRSAVAVLNKAMPDLQRTELTGRDGEPVQVTTLPPGSDQW